ncbi:MAG: transposase [Serratia symbiotica]|nr:transposase [Serratia symbiotica]
MKSVNIPFKTPTPGKIAQLAIKHGLEKRRIWRKLHLFVDTETHNVICTELSLSNITDT